MFQDIENSVVLSAALVVFLVVLAVWSAIWRGVGLWHAARRGHKGWFIALLLINTFGILEIIYIFLIARRRQATTTTATV